MPNILDPYRLPHGPYTPPALRRRDRATCLFRDADVVITSWSDGRISWPRCRRPGTHGGGSGLLVDAELARAVRLESSLAIQHGWGVSYAVVCRWRKALGVPALNEGSARLRQELNAQLADGMRGKSLPPEQVERRRRTALELGLRPPPGSGMQVWTAKELALLGTVPDGELAARIGRTEKAVTVKRLKRGIPTLADRRRREHRWAGSRDPLWPGARNVVPPTYFVPLMAATMRDGPSAAFWAVATEEKHSPENLHQVFTAVSLTRHLSRLYFQARKYP